MKRFSRFAALNYRDFRLLWFGQLVSTLGSQMQQAAVSWHIFTLLQGQRHTLHVLGRTFDIGVDALGLGALGLVRVVPIVVFALLGGMLADAIDRRRLMMWTQSTAALLAFMLAFFTFSGRVNVLTIYLLTAALAATSAFDNPARQSLVPNLVPREHLANAISLNTLLWQIGTILGPALAGVLIARLNIGWVYAVNALSFGAVLIALWRMHYRGRAAVDLSGLTLDAFLEGVRFTYRTRLIWSTMLLDFFATFFSSARTMLPLVASEILHVGPTGYGILATAQAVGALIAGLVLSLRRQIRHQGLVLLSSVAVYGAATAFFGLSTVFWLSYLFFALTGAADTVSTVIRGTLRQVLTPDHLRGRMTSVNMVFFMGGPQLGELEAGLVASWLGVSFAIVSGGLATVLLTLWVAWKYPALRRYDA
ncbi:MAG: MFS transporter [Ardenticatenia bacterium]|nr:MAG: MFS transporter [Ardenticatenia bacterium]